MPALAQPVLTNKARMPELCAKCCLHKMTGAAQNLLLVNTPATVLPFVNVITNTSFLLGLRMFAWAKPKLTPFTGNSFSAFGAIKLTGIVRS